jgi:hypothetical protein
LKKNGLITISTMESNAILKNGVGIGTNKDKLPQSD